MNHYYNADTSNRKLRLNLYGPIGRNPLLNGDGVTSAWVAEQIISAGEIDQIEVYINSVGGDVFEGLAIYNELKQFPGQVNVHIIGLAASIASIIAMAGNQRVIHDGAELMIHQAAGMTFGTADAHVAQVKNLRRMDKKLATIYSEATGCDAQIIAEMMSEETWFEADDALADGFVTHRSPQAAVSPPKATLGLLNQYHQVPLKVAMWAEQKSGKTPVPTMEPQAMDEDKPKEEEPQAMEEDKPSYEELEAKVAELQAALEEMTPDEEPGEGEEEEMPAEAQAIAKAFAHDNGFAVAMIAAGKTLAQAHVAYVDHARKAIEEARSLAEGMADGANPVAIAPRKEEDATAPEVLAIFNRAKGMKSDIGRASFLNDRGIDPNEYTKWLKNHG